MNIQVFYDNGRIEEFNVEHFTKPEPFEGTNMLTNFEVRFDDLESESLWLQAHFYDIRPEYRDTEEPDATPVARRMRGWRFLLVDRSEIGSVAKILVNNELVAWRQGDDLINGVRFQAQELACYSDETTSSINRKAVALHDYLAHANPSIANDEDALCQMFGFTRGAYERAIGAEDAQPVYAPDESEEDDNDGGNWIEEAAHIEESDE